MVVKNNNVFCDNCGKITDIITKSKRTKKVII